MQHSPVSFQIELNVTSGDRKSITNINKIIFIVLRMSRQHSESTRELKHTCTLLGSRMHPGRRVLNFRWGCARMKQGAQGLPDHSLRWPLAPGPCPCGRVSTEASARRSAHTWGLKDDATGSADANR